MLSGFASSVSRALTRSRAEQPTPAVAPWGDGILDLSITTAWSPRSWSDMSDDELVLFHPGLLDADNPEFGRTPLLRAALQRRLGVSTTSSHPMIRSLLAAIEDGAPGLRHPQTLADALHASIHSSCNAAYVYPHYAWAHELFAAGAWLGILQTGRAALMPEFIASVLRESFTSPQRNEPVNAVLQQEAEIACGTGTLLRRAEHVLRSGYSGLVKPRHGIPIAPA